MLPPGPKGPENLAYMRWMRNNPLELFKQLSQRYGDISCVQLGPQLLCMVNEPALIQRILVQDNSSFKKGRFLELAKDLLGEGLLTSEGEHHKRQRLLIQPMFHRQMIRSYGEIMVDWSERFAGRWQSDQPLDLAREMMKLTLAIVGEALFGANVEHEAPDVGRALEAVLDITVIGKPLKLLMRNWPTPDRARFLAAKGLLDRTIQSIIDAHRQGEIPPARRTLIGLLLEARDEEGQGMSDQLVRDEALTLFLAGHETTANAMAWSWYLLAGSPRVEALFHAELREVLGGRKP
ncbi:MAG: cytochrome P450, partial [Candidatus Melainabacteria bacterium HGW-Melainabacteria-1]